MEYNIEEIGFGWFGSKLAKSAEHFASNIVKTAGHELGQVAKTAQSAEGAVSGVIKKVPIIGGPIHTIMDTTFKISMAPTNLVIGVAEGQRIDHAVLNNLKEQVKEFKQVAPYAEMVVSLVPGVGQGVAAMLAAGVALSEGQPISEVIKAGLIAALPGGPLVQAAVTMGVDTIQHVAKGEKLNLQTLSQSAGGAATAALGLPPESSQALTAGIAITGGIAKGQPLDKTLADAAVNALPLSEPVKRAMTEASTLSLELVHGNSISITQTARLTALTGILPPSNPLRDSITTAVALSQKTPQQAHVIMASAIHSGLADTLIGIGAEKAPPIVKNAIKSGTALGSGLIYQEHRAVGLSKVAGKLIESGVQQSKNYPSFNEARKLAARPAAPLPGTPGGPPVSATRGFDYGSGLGQHQVGLFDVITARKSLSPADQRGFDMASATRIGLVANPRPQELSNAGHAGYAMSMGMQSHSQEEKMAMMRAIQQSPSATVGATVAVKEVAAKRENWLVRLFKALGLL